MEEFNATLAGMTHRDRVRIHGFAPVEDLPAWYNAADLFVFPSLYEGFGFPPLEAMACGTPVVTSNVSSLPEVVGEAALTVAPLDTDALTEAMGRILGDRRWLLALVRRSNEQQRSPGIARRQEPSLPITPHWHERHVTVRDLGEFGLIRALRDALPESVRTGDRLPVAIGDDAAVWNPNPGERSSSRRTV